MSQDAWWWISVSGQVWWGLVLPNLPEVGDFNVNLLSTNNHPISQTLEISSKYNLTQVVSEPTRGHLLIDHVYIYYWTPLPCSIHAAPSPVLVLLTIIQYVYHWPGLFPQHKKKQTEICWTFWRYSAANHDAISNDLMQLTPWHPPDEWCKLLFLSVMSKHIFLIKILVRRPYLDSQRSSSPWPRNVTGYTIKPSHQISTLPSSPSTKPATRLWVPWEQLRRISNVISHPLLILSDNFGLLTTPFKPNWQWIPTPWFIVLTHFTAIQDSLWAWWDLKPDTRNLCQFHCATSVHLILSFHFI